MNTSEKIEQLEVAVEILRAIDYYNTQIRNKEISIQIIGDYMPDVKEKHLNDIDTYERCIVRLKQRYAATLEKCKI